MGVLTDRDIPSYPDLRGRIAIVTGASRRRGIGAAVCRGLAEQGCDLLFTSFTTYDRGQPHGADEGGAEALAKELETLGVRAERLEIDLASATAAEVVLDETQRRLGSPSILINNAAHSTHDGFQHLDAAGLDDHYAVNVRAMALLSVGFARRFDAGAGGRIINLSSGQGLAGMPEELAYAASKGAVDAFTRSLAQAVAPLGVTVNAVDPGATDSGWMDAALRDRLSADAPAGRVGLPSDAARLIVFLASAGGGWISGQVLHARGG